MENESRIEKSKLVESSPTDAVAAKAAVCNCNRKLRSNRKRTSNKFFADETVGTADTAYAVATVKENRNVNELNPASVKTDANTEKPTIVRIDGARAKKLANDETQRDPQRTKQSLCGRIEKEMIQRQHRLTNENADLAKPLLNAKPTKHCKALEMVRKELNDEHQRWLETLKLLMAATQKTRIESGNITVKCGKSQEVGQGPEGLEIAGNFRRVSAESGGGGFDRH
ncbi:hypothetical protein HK104_005943 [Borealophlyctis nickersoniae]|nr:hypothetical protein HK104_005943 [Borealophlyctis nickersoniae]